MDGSLQQHGGRNPSVNVVLAVAQISGRSATDLPPLYESIDPDVLDEVVTTVPGVSVQFEYAGSEITVREGGVDVDGQVNVDVDVEAIVDADEET